MSEVFKLGITSNNNQIIKEVQTINLLAGKGIVGDRHFHEYNAPHNQLTLIESENIDYYNKNFNLSIPYLSFRRNIVTKGISLNNLIGKKILVGKVELNIIDLCRPCKHLKEKLLYDNIIKEFLRKGGIRCEVLNSEDIKLGDKIKVL